MVREYENPAEQTAFLPSWVEKLLNEAHRTSDVDSNTKQGGGKDRQSGYRNRTGSGRTRDRKRHFHKPRGGSPRQSTQRARQLGGRGRPSAPTDGPGGHCAEAVTAKGRTRGGVCMGPGPSARTSQATARPAGFLLHEVED